MARSGQKRPFVYAVSYSFSGRLPLGTSEGGRGSARREGGCCLREWKHAVRQWERALLCRPFIQVLIICSVWLIIVVFGGDILFNGSVHLPSLTVLGRSAVACTALYIWIDTYAHAHAKTPMPKLTSLQFQARCFALPHINVRWC